MPEGYLDWQTPEEDRNQELKGRDNNKNEDIS